jgi:hypothetical protein
MNENTNSDNYQETRCCHIICKGPKKGEQCCGRRREGYDKCYLHLTVKQRQQWQKDKLSTDEETFQKRKENARISSKNYQRNTRKNQKRKEIAEKQDPNIFHIAFQQSKRVYSNYIKLVKEQERFEEFNQNPLKFILDTEPREVIDMAVEWCDRIEEAQKSAKRKAREDKIKEADERREAKALKAHEREMEKLQRIEARRMKREEALKKREDIEIRQRERVAERIKRLQEKKTHTNPLEDLRRELKA